jgi:hypothetical protein
MKTSHPNSPKNPNAKPGAHAQKTKHAHLNKRTAGVKENGKRSYLYGAGRSVTAACNAFFERRGMPINGGGMREVIFRNAAGDAGERVHA